MLSFTIIKNYLVLCLTLNLALAVAQKVPQNLPNAEVATSYQQVDIDGKTVQLIAKAGTYKLRDENNNPMAFFGYTSYIMEVLKIIAQSFLLIIEPGSSSFSCIWAY